MQCLSASVGLCWQGLEVGAVKLMLLMVLHEMKSMSQVFHFTWLQRTCPPTDTPTGPRVLQELDASKTETKNTNCDSI